MRGTGNGEQGTEDGFQSSPPGPLLAIPNFSEGRDYHFLRALREAAEQSGAVLHTLAWDVDHNRAVAALSGEREPLLAALLSMATLAVGALDLTRHQGVHPRLGALDVLPIVPTTPSASCDAAALVEALAPQIADLGGGVPVFLYERSAREGRNAELPDIRRGQFEGWVGKELAGEHSPDFGPPRLHPTAGAVILGARGPLVAFNVNLSVADPAMAKSIAKEIRNARDEGGGGDGRGGGRGVDPEGVSHPSPLAPLSHPPPLLRGVRAMGVPLASRGMSQVSTNITDPDAISIADVWAFVRERAGEAVAWCEVIGAIRATDLAKAPPDMPVRVWPEQVLNY